METHTVEREAGRKGQGVTLADQTVRDFQSYIVDRPEDGMFTVDRALFRDPELFELEMKYIFEGTWVYLAHESQVARPHDFYTTTLGRQPVVLLRSLLFYPNVFFMITDSCAWRTLRRGGRLNTWTNLLWSDLGVGAEPHPV